MSVTRLIREPAATQPWTAIALIYGDYPWLAKRCLDSWRQLPGDQVRKVVLCNEVSDATRARVQAYYEAGEIDVLYSSPTNLPKYVYMRKVLYDDAIMEGRNNLMWFDDDSYLKPLTLPGEVLKSLAACLQVGVMAGARYTMPYARGQRAWIKKQPWYDEHRPIRNKIAFLTGGWWVARWDFFQEINYPWPELLHNGGDTMLGECCHHLNLEQVSLGNNCGWVAINADDHGRESQAPRRGLNTKPLGARY
jgi:hypothetical protein